MLLKSIIVVFLLYFWFNVKNWENNFTQYTNFKSFLGSIRHIFLWQLIIILISFSNDFYFWINSFPLNLMKWNWPLKGGFLIIQIRHTKWSGWLYHHCNVLVLSYHHGLNYKLLTNLFRVSQASQISLVTHDPDVIKKIALKSRFSPFLLAQHCTGESAIPLRELSNKFVTWTL